MKRPPKETEEAAWLVTRRGMVLGFVQVAFMAGLGLRMRQMQVTEADSYRLLAEENRINVRLIPPSRGIIYVRHGIEIARNAQNYRVVIVREDVPDVDETIAKVRQLIEIEDKDVERALKEMSRRSAFVPITLADQLKWEDIAELAINA
ncbi:MAG: penicillin-binding protein 2, partial [Pseudomonadota bacterium]